MVAFDGENFKEMRGLGHVGENFDAGSEALAAMSGHAAIGHNRYSTTGQSELKNIQPFLTELAFGHFGLAHNGNLINAERLRSSLSSHLALYSNQQLILRLLFTS